MNSQQLNQKRKQRNVGTMTPIKETLIKQIATVKQLDPRVVRLIADFPLKFSRDKISDPDNLRPIRIRYLGVFQLKNKLLRQEIKKK